MNEDDIEFVKHNLPGLYTWLDSIQKGMNTKQDEIDTFKVFLDRMDRVVNQNEDPPTTTKKRV